MALNCPDCGAPVLNLRAHVCSRGKSSGGIAEGREPPAAKLPARQADAGLRKERFSPVASAGIKARPPETDSGAPWPRRESVKMKTARPAGSQTIAVSLPQMVAEGLHTEVPKRGRPKKGEKRDKPWEAEGISKASWYRNRKAEQRK